MIICADGLTGIKEAITTAFPKTDYQRCMVHMVRNTLKYVASKDMKSFPSDLKTIYCSSSYVFRKNIELFCLFFVALNLCYIMTYTSLFEMLVNIHIYIL